MREKPTIALVTPAGIVRASEDFVLQRKKDIDKLGYKVTEINLYCAAESEVAAATHCERATGISHALTKRSYDLIWPSRGGYGTTATLAFLKNMLPPIISPKMMVGFSDVSFLGNALALAYPNFTFVHGKNFYAQDLLQSNSEENEVLFKIIDGNPPINKVFTSSVCAGKFASKISGVCFPVNLSLLNSLLCVSGFELPENTILFIEDCNEAFYRLERKLDDIINSSQFKKVKAVVLGEFTNCIKYDGSELSAAEIAKSFSGRGKVPVCSLPIFGHGTKNFPLVSLSKVEIIKKGQAVDISLGFVRSIFTKVAEIFDVKNADLVNPSETKIHFTGIGGTGMAAVAGLFKNAGFMVSGSDTPIFPPMDKVISDMGVPLAVGYKAQNIDEVDPDSVVLCNAISRKNVANEGNPELDRILEKNISMFSFPSVLRRYFLQHSQNIVVTGTHGKTTTTSLIAQILSYLGLNPSLFVGGAPKNFEAGYCLGNKNLFVLEGDEYDTAFFDKGPKFLHYEPTIAILNNIEFDHADIYPNIEAIENEFTHMTDLVYMRKGIVIANFDDARVKRIVTSGKALTVAFGTAENTESVAYWKLAEVETKSTGITVKIVAPWNELLTIKTQMFGWHNALNLTGALAAIHAFLLLQEPDFTNYTKEQLKEVVTKPLLSSLINKLKKGAYSFEGVKRRFELIGVADNIAVFDDFAHHPTAITTTIEAFKMYSQAAKRKGKLIVCFEPRNATMRRKVLEKDLAASLSLADVVLLGKVPLDLRVPENERMSGARVVSQIKGDATYFDDNENLLRHVMSTVKQDDTLVFMGPSGSFSGYPLRLLEFLGKGKTI